MKPMPKTAHTQIPWKRAGLAMLAGICLLFVATSALADIDVIRRWASVRPTVDGVFHAAEWSNSIVTPLTNGEMRTKNTRQFLYVLLDFVRDTHDDPVPTTPAEFGGDYFTLAVDVDQNHAVTPNVDFIYSGCQDGSEFKKAMYLGANTWTGCQPTSALSLGAYGFGPTTASAVPHRYYEFRFDLTELGIDTAAWTTMAGEAAKVRMHVSMVSMNPHRVSRQPQPLQFPDLSNAFYLIDLSGSSGYPAGTAGPTFAGVGLVPSTFINALGNANIHIANYYSATDAPFGGNLHVFSNWARLRNVHHARSYRVWFRKDAGPWTQLLQTWTNFFFDAGSGDWIPTSFGPDSDGKYPVPGPGTIWYLPNLLIGWQSGQFPDGTYRLKLELFDAADHVLPAPPSNLLTLRLDNTAPVPTINEVTFFNGATTSTVPACAIINQGDPPAGFNFNISVNDARGGLNALALTAIHGNNLSETIYQDSYSPAHVGESGPGKWNGVNGLVVPVGGAHWRAPDTCAYSFILSASSRSQNGYGLVFPYVDYHVSLTILNSVLLNDITPCGTPEAPAAATSGCKPAGVE
jgi:hypothetical protein